MKKDKEERKTFVPERAQESERRSSFDERSES